VREAFTAGEEMVMLWAVLGSWLQVEKRTFAYYRLDYIDTTEGKPASDHLCKNNSPRQIHVVTTPNMWDNITVVQ
tara:strand:- start:90 stop:314 length:225 start_codon:yes stop_codon:yes gene_type:complete